MRIDKEQWETQVVLAWLARACACGRGEMLQSASAARIKRIMLQRIVPIAQALRVSVCIISSLTYCAQKCYGMLALELRIRTRSVLRPC